jgi:hypothetical protein
MTRHHLEAWFGLNPNQLPRVSGWTGTIRFDGTSEAWPARFDFSGGTAQPGKMIYTPALTARSAGPGRSRS